MPTKAYLYLPTPTLMPLIPRLCLYAMHIIYLVSYTYLHTIHLYLPTVCLYCVPLIHSLYNLLYTVPTCV